MMFNAEVKNLFQKLSDRIFNELISDEKLSLNLAAEKSDYIRFNSSKVRQTTAVEQLDLEMIFLKNQRHLQINVTVPIDLESASQTCLTLLKQARAETAILPEDPFAPEFKVSNNVSQDFNSQGLDVKAMIECIGQHTQGSEFTGLYAGGDLIRAQKNSLGQSHWFSTQNCFVDYSLYTVNVEQENKAIKGLWANSTWNADSFLKDYSAKREMLPILKRKSMDLKPGSYRTYLAPGAFVEIVGMLNWGALSYSAVKRGNSAFGALYREQESLSPLLTVRENFDLGLSPLFNSLGEIPAKQMNIIENGKLKNLLTSSSSAKEFGVTANGANPNETSRSLEVLPGTLKETNILKELNTGLYLSNLHYLNWSDLQTARITGMTRYACFWIEKGEIVGPIKDLRFDDSLYSLFGKSLQAMTAECALEVNVMTYERRNPGGAKVPGLLVNEMKFTL